MLPSISAVAYEIEHERDPARRRELEHLAVQLLRLRIREQEAWQMRLGTCRLREFLDRWRRGEDHDRRDGAAA